MLTEEELSRRATTLLDEEGHSCTTSLSSSSEATATASDVEETTGTPTLKQQKHGKSLRMKRSLNMLLGLALRFVDTFHLAHPVTWISFIVAVECDRQSVASMYGNTILRQHVMNFLLYCKVGTLIHEIGHGLIMNVMKVPFHPIVFLPHRGAFVARKETLSHVYDEALVALGGPLLGVVGAAWMGVMGHYVDSTNTLLLAAHELIAINAANLFNIWGCHDGARVVQVIVPHLATVVTLGLMVYFGSKFQMDEVHFAHFMMGARDCFRSLHNRANDNVPNDVRNGSSYYFLPCAQRICLAAFYLFVLVAMATSPILMTKGKTASWIIATFWSVLFGCFLRHVLGRVRQNENVFAGIKIVNHEQRTNEVTGDQNVADTEAEPMEEVPDQGEPGRNAEKPLHGTESTKLKFD